MEKICRTLWFLYLCTAPVYWLPYISGEHYLFFKKALFSIATIATLVYGLAKSNLRFSMRICGLTGFILLFISFTPGVILSNPGAGFKMSMNLAYAASTFICFHILIQANPRNLEFFAYSALFIGCLSWYSAMAKIGLVPDYNSPTLISGAPVSFSGFTGLRTGWSNGISFYVPFAVCLAVICKSKYIKIICLLAILGIFLSQLSVAGRAGMLSTLLACSLSIIFFANAKQKVIFTSIIVVAFIMYIPSLVEHLRFNRLEEGVNEDSLNHFSAGRIGSYYYALGIIAENPITGIGFGNSDIRGHSVHNMLLRLTAETGVLFLILFLSIIGGALRQFRNLRKFKGALALLFIVLQGLLTSQFEPGMLIPVFQNSTIFWAALGMIAGIPFLYNVPKNKKLLIKTNKKKKVGYGD